MTQRKNGKMASCSAGEKTGGSRTVALTWGRAGRRHFQVKKKKKNKNSLGAEHVVVTSK